MEAAASAGATVAEASRIGLGSSVEALLLTIVAMVVLRFELIRRSGGWVPSLASQDAGRYAESIRRIAKQCAPEVAGLVATLTLAAALRARGDTGNEDRSATWLEIKSQWPMLMTADTLLSLQAMLRFMVLLSTVLRGSGGPTPLSEEATALWLCGAVARGFLLMRTDTYLMDGPLGGAITGAFEVAVIPMLLAISRGVVGKVPATVVCSVAGTAAFAWRNRLGLAEDVLSDSLFVFAHCSDVLAALAYLLRTALIDSGCRRADASAAFAHVMMPVQAALSAYYFLQAFPFMQELVAEGQPFEVLQVGNTIVLGAYLAAAALYIAECLEAEPLHAGGPTQASILVDTPRARDLPRTPAAF